jgi:hypothetical protein
MEININNQENIDKNEKDKMKINAPNENMKNNNGLGEKEKKINVQKKTENIKSKIQNKNNEKELGNTRLNNFINFSNINTNQQHNRYYTTNHYFKNFIKKSNYNKNKDNSNNKNEQDDSYINPHFNENRPFSFTSRYNFIKDNCTNNGLDYILGNSNIYNKDLDNKKSGYNYKNYNRGKRNNYINKNIFFNNQIKKQNDINLNYYNDYSKQNSDESEKIMNNNNNESQNNNQNLIINQENKKYIRMNEIFNLDNINITILNIANNIINNQGY